MLAANATRFMLIDPSLFFFISDKDAGRFLFRIHFEGHAAVLTPDTGRVIH